MDTSHPSLKAQGAQALRDGDLDQAVDCLSRAVGMDDHDPDAKGLLGEAYRQKGRYVDARRVLTAAVKQQPQNPDFRFNLGAVLERSGDIQGAAVAYTEALSLNPQHELATARLAAIGMRVQKASPGSSPPLPPAAPTERASLPPPVFPPTNAAPNAAAPNAAAPNAAAPTSPSAQPPPFAPPSAAPQAIQAAASPPQQPMQPGTVQCPRCRRITYAGPVCQFCMAPLAAVGLPPYPVGLGTGVGIGGVFQRPHRGGLILGLGIGGLVFNMTCGLLCSVTGLVGLALAITAWVMGNSDLREMDTGLMDQSGRGMVQGGRICGMINCGLAALFTLGMIGYFIFALTAGLAASAK